MLRLITSKEIEEVIDFIEPRKAIPFDTAMAEVEYNKSKLRDQLKGQKIIPSILPKLRAQLQKLYQRSLIQPGEDVGILTAQSFGQLQTQNTLNSFHKAGLAEKTVVSGVPRFAELLNATRSPKGSSCMIYFEKGSENLQSLKEVINHSLVEFSLEKLSESMKMTKGNREKWYDNFALIYGEMPWDKFKNCVSIRFKRNLLREYDITLEMIAQKITETYNDLFCVFSPLYEGRMDVFVDCDCITIPEDKILFVTKDNKVDVYLEEVVIPNLTELFICGVKNISNIFYASLPNGKWYVETEGSNFSEVLALPHVDFPNVITNDMWEIYSILGIEAARQYLLEELGNIMNGINPCHSKLLVDKMTYNGIITSISRYAQRGENTGPLTKASFEETSDNLMTAAIFGLPEKTDGVSASIICGKLGKFGTGMFDVQVDVMKILGQPAIVNEFVFECD